MADLKIAYTHYTNAFPLPKSFYLKIDFHQEDSLKIFRIYPKNDLFELFYKTPDCFILDSGVLTYLYTPEYQKRKSNSFRETLLKTTTLLSGFLDVKVDWEKDSIIEVTGSSINITGNIDPPFLEYKVYKGEILEIKEVFQMYYPDTSQPLGIPLDRFRKSE